jgi:hypothetical protein
MSCGPGAFAPAATRINSNPVSCVRLMGSSPCLLFGRCVACSAGVAITGFPCTVPHEHSDIGLDSHLERSSATPHGKARLGLSEASNPVAKRRGCAGHRECLGRQHGLVESGHAILLRTIPRRFATGFDSASIVSVRGSRPVAAARWERLGDSRSAFPYGNARAKRFETGILMVGTGRFELPTPRTPSECSTRLSHVPTQSSRLG